LPGDAVGGAQAREYIKKSWLAGGMKKVSSNKDIVPVRRPVEFTE
jgi:hypothetical protein